MRKIYTQLQEQNSTIRELKDKGKLEEKIVYRLFKHNNSPITNSIFGIQGGVANIQYLMHVKKNKHRKKQKRN